jgi:hypothetical protein
MSEAGAAVDPSPSAPVHALPRRRQLPALGIALLLASCGSPPTHYYTLTADPPPPPGAGGYAHRGLPIIVGHVELPGDIDRAGFVTRVGPNRLDVSDQDRWAGPLDEMIQRALAADLRERLASQNVLMPGDPVPEKGARAIIVAIRQFMGDSAGRVVLEADWTEQAGPLQNPVMTRHVYLTAYAGNGTASAIVAAMSRLIGQLADRIAGAIAI